MPPSGPRLGPKGSSRMEIRHYSHMILTSLLLCSFCSAVDWTEHLVAIHASTVAFSFPKGLNGKDVHGSGICIQQDCSVVVTPYLIQRLAGATRLKVAGGRTDKVLSLALDSDPNKGDITIGRTKATMSFDIAHDVSFVYTKKAIRMKSGIPYSYEFHVGQKVHVAGYHDHTFTNRDALIIGKNVPLLIGQSALNDNLIVDINLVPGDSGSAVLDDDGRLLGMVILSGPIAFGNGHLSVSVALPTETLARAFVKLDPVLGPAMFPNMPLDKVPSIAPRPVTYEDSDLPADVSPVIPHLSAVATNVPNAVKRLNTASALAASQLVNFIAKQCLVLGTQKPVCQEVSVIDDEQNFRKINSKGKLGQLVNASSIQGGGAWKRTSWYEVLGEIADNPWDFQGSRGDHYLFTFDSTIEDDRCYYREYTNEVPLFGGRHLPWEGAVACFEAVLTDRNFNVESTFTEMYPPTTCIAQLYQSAIYYDWINLPGLSDSVLLPVSERTTTKFAGRDELVYSTMLWSNYSKFRAEHKIQLITRRW